MNHRLRYLPLVLAFLWPSSGNALAPDGRDTRPDGPVHTLLLDYRRPMPIPGTACTVTLTDYRWAPCPPGMYCIHAGTETVGLLLEGPNGLRMHLRTRRIIGHDAFRGQMRIGGIRLRIEAIERRPLRALIQVLREPEGGPCTGPPR